MLNNLVPDDRIPVIVGVGEIVDRPKEISKGLEPLVLLEQALKRAEADSGGKLLGEIQSLDIVNFLSWRYRDPEKQLSDRLGITPKHAYYGPVGGESPIRYLHQAAQRIARGECSVAAVCGAEARAAGIAEDRLVHVCGGASAEEPRDYLIRDQFFESHPQNAVLKAVMELAGGDGKAFDAIELYSCF